MPVVNGFFCRDCAEIDLAKKGVNPAKPHPELSPPAVVEPRPNESVQAVQQARRVELGTNRPVQHGPQGTRLNLYA